MVGGSWKETMDLGFILLGTSQQSVEVILKETVLLGVSDPVLPSRLQFESLSLSYLDPIKLSNELKYLQVTDH